MRRVPWYPPRARDVHRQHHQPLPQHLRTASLPGEWQSMQRTSRQQQSQLEPKSSNRNQRIRAFDPVLRKLNGPASL